MSRIILAAVINPTLGIAGVLPDAPINVAYSATLRITNGLAGPYKLTLVRGTLPEGLTYTDNGDGTGTISGTPTEAGLVSPTFRAQDVRREPVEKTFQLRVIALPLTLTGTITGSEVGEPFGGSVSASGGVLPYTYSLTGDVPPGMTINPSTGVVGGTASSAGYYAFSARVTDGDGTVATVPVSVEVEAAPIEIDGVWPDATVNVPYDEMLPITGGNGTYTNIGVQSGSLPTGLNVEIQSNQARLYGTPTVVNSYSFTLRVTDSLGATGDTPFSMDVTQPTYDQEVLADSPLLYLKLDESSGGTGTTIADSSGNGNDLAVTFSSGSATLADVSVAAASGLAGIGRSMNFTAALTGGGTVSVADSTPSASLLLTSGAITFECWWMRDTGFRWLLFIGSGNGSTNNYLEIRQGTSSSSGVLEVKGTGGTINFVELHGISDTTSWHHVVIVINAARTSADFYVDGAFVDSYPVSGTFTQAGASPTLYIGQRPDRSERTKLNNVAVYNSALSSARIAAHYAARNVA